MGLFDSALDVLGLTPDQGAQGQAIQSASFDPYNIQTSMGGASYDPANRLFSTSLDPRLQAAQGDIYSQLQGINPQQQLSLFRQQAQPYNQAQQLGLESRLFSQGRLGHSAVDQPGGERRALYDAMQNQDFGFQLQAQDQATQQRTNLLNQLFGIGGFEQSLFSPQATFGQIQTGAGANVAGLQQQNAYATPNLVGSFIGAGIQGYAGRA